MGFDEVPLARIAEDVSWGVAPCKPIERRVPAGGAAAGTPFSFVAGVNIGPLLARREAFLRVGGFDEAFSCAGQPGIHLDTELSLQMWRRGYQVGLWYSAVANGVGGRKTRTNPEQKRARLRNDNVNGKRCERLMRSHGATKSLQSLELQGNSFTVGGGMLKKTPPAVKAIEEACKRGKVRVHLKKQGGGTL